MELQRLYGSRRRDAAEIGCRVNLRWRRNYGSPKQGAAGAMGRRWEPGGLEELQAAADVGSG